MFMPRPFREDDHRAAVAMARSVAFGHLVAAGPDGLASTPMPFLIDDEGTRVRGHLARANPLLGVLPCDALLVVPVDDAYISPGWYPSKAEHGKVVPTWNYEIVHVHGHLAAHDREWTDQLVRDLTDHHEATMDEPWSVDDAPPDYIGGLLKAIVGVSIDITEVVAKRKLSQNKLTDDLTGAADGLEGRRHRDAEVAEAMRRHDPHRRPTVGNDD